MSRRQRRRPDWHAGTLRHLIGNPQPTDRYIVGLWSRWFSQCWWMLALIAVLYWLFG